MLLSTYNNGYRTVEPINRNDMRDYADNLNSQGRSK